MPGEHISTGVLGLDILMKGGWKRGTLNEIWGEPSTGKTTLALEGVWSRRPDERPVTWISTRGAIDFVPTDSAMVIAEPRTAERVFDIAMAASGVGASFIVIDDANHLVRARELIDDSYIPDEHREFKDELKLLKQAVKNSGATVLFLSQPRDTMRAPIRGTGISEKAHNRVSLRIRKVQQDKTAFVTAEIKNAGTVASYVVQPGRGVNRPRQLLHWGVKSGLVENSGTWYTFSNTTGRELFKVQGIDQFTEYMFGHPYDAAMLEGAIRAHYEIDNASDLVVG